MKLENTSINQWEQKCNSNGSSAVELTIRADVVKDGSYSTFCNPDVRRDFENYISQYKYNGDYSHPIKTVEDLKKENDILRTSLDYEIKKNNEYSEQLAIMSAKENNATLCLKNISLLLGIDEDSGALEVFDKVKEISEEWQQWQQKYISFRAKFRDIFDSFSYHESEDDIIARVKAVRNVREITERHNTELIKENGELKDKVKDLEEGVKANRIERYKLEKDLEDIADMLQVGALRTITDILDKAHYWVHEHSKDLSGKLDAFCRFRDDVVTTLEVDDDATIDDVLHMISSDANLAHKAGFICGYFDVKQVPLTSIAENLCLEIKEKVISEYKMEVEAKRQDAIRDAAKKAGSLGNGVYLDGLTVEQNLRAENVRLKAENEKHKKYISELEGSLDCIHCESAAALGYECE